MSLQQRLALLIAHIKGVTSAIDTRTTALEARAEVVEITQAAYDALSPPDPNTIYIVIG